jgi:long-chain fatty acid transport protein
VIWLICSMALGGGFEVAQQDAAAGGTGHAGTGRDDEASAAWFNPAALADGAGGRIALGASLAASTIKSEALAEAEDAPWSAQTEPALSTPPYLYGSFSHADWVVGVAANVPFAGGVKWAENWEQRFEIISSKPMFFRVAPFFGYAIGPVRLAAGMHVDTGSVTINKATDHISEEGEVLLKMRGTGFGFDGAAYVAAGEYVGIGLSYKSRSQMPLSGEADFTVPDAFAELYPDQAVTSKWVLPDRLVLGVAYDRHSIAAFFDVGLTLWSVNQATVMDFAEEQTSDIVQTNEWQNALALRLGGEFRAHRYVDVRVGTYVDGLLGAPPPAEYLAPSSPDMTRVGFTTGARFRIPSFVNIDVYYEHMRLLGRESSSDDAPLASYSGYAHVVGLGIAFQRQGLVECVVGDDLFLTDDVLPDMDGVEPWDDVKEE